MQIIITAWSLANKILRARKVIQNMHLPYSNICNSNTKLYQIVQTSIETNVLKSF